MRKSKVHDKIISNILSMNKEQLKKFLATLTPDQLEYLDIFLKKEEFKYTK